MGGNLGLLICFVVVPGAIIALVAFLKKPGGKSGGRGPGELNHGFGASHHYAGDGSNSDSGSGSSWGDSGSSFGGDGGSSSSSS